MIVDRLTRVATILVVGFAIFVAFRMLAHFNAVEAAILSGQCAGH